MRIWGYFYPFIKVFNFVGHWFHYMGSTIKANNSTSKQRDKRKKFY